MTAEPAGVRIAGCDGADLPEALILGVQREASTAGPRPGLDSWVREATPDVAIGFQRRMRVCIVVVAATRWA